jgi:hypothetical protein
VLFRGVWFRSALEWPLKLILGLSANKPFTSHSLGFQLVYRYTFIIIISV